MLPIISPMPRLCRCIVIPILLTTGLTPFLEIKFLVLIYARTLNLFSVKLYGTRRT
ncbi:hypothetical protein PHJA_002935900 [Phtheirospermum japonicum]|uniref:Uncharacterized protein n=1 Tax=Phtheirospermum japonicum TaxID=374723 RepID=A0A830DDY1_9LAMI|nr:hypothetical protein PHJA_002935900 [Phtheirospermum japonicum]